MEQDDASKCWPCFVDQMVLCELQILPKVQKALATLLEADRRTRAARKAMTLLIINTFIVEEGIFEGNRTRFIFVLMYKPKSSGCNRQ